MLLPELREHRYAAGGGWGRGQAVEGTRWKGLKCVWRRQLSIGGKGDGGGMEIGAATTARGSKNVWRQQLSGGGKGDGGGIEIGEGMRRLNISGWHWGGGGRESL
eukprot:5339-Chlamydomonas_euryale.AAC.2